MFPFGQGQSEGSLEDRLRGMILNNQATVATAVPSLSSVPLPPHLRGSSTEQQAHYFSSLEATKLAQSRPQERQTVQDAVTPPKQKKPNQAQRRQMNAQMTIPIDSRPNYHNAGGGSGRNQNYRGQPNSPQTSHAQSWRSPRQDDPARSNIQHSSRQANSHTSPRHQNHSSMPVSSRFAPQHPPGSPTVHQHPGSNQQHNTRRAVGEYHRPAPGNRQLFQPGSSQGNSRQDFRSNSQDMQSQISYIEALVADIVPRIQIEEAEEIEKEAFRSKIEQICQQTIAAFETVNNNQSFDLASVQLHCFGSMRSGFATRASDMDLALVAPQCVPHPHSPESRIPRLLEKALLDHGYGARLLTRTRVPIIKLCEKPTEKLLTDLRDARLKWDQGLDVEGDNEETDDHVEDHHRVASASERSPNMTKAQLSNKGTNSPAINTKTGNTQASNTSKPDAHVDVTTNTANRTCPLNQQEHQSLHDYHNSAKRMLRKHEGRDLTANAPIINEQETQALNEVCRAFILGLNDKALSERVQKHPSVAPIFDDSYSGRPRALQGLWTQIEGERLAMAFADRKFLELNDRAEAEAARTIASWEALQSHPAENIDFMFFNRQLFATLEKLKQIRSLQIMVLEQMPFEDPIVYHARTKKLQQGIRTRGNINAETTSDLARDVTRRYIAGINSESIRNSITSEDLHDVHREHVKLQLSSDYENALKKNVFNEADSAIIKQYITLLQDPEMMNDQAKLEIIQQIQTLSDPTETSTLKPRDPYKDKLEFPKGDIGVQCDINFSAHLALHNTLLLRCYAASDPRVKPMILFVKNWAKVRGINTAYRGTLSSYGYVLMVLHYLVNVAQPFVCPNLQLVNAEPPAHLSPAEREARSTCEGRDVRFWRNEQEIAKLAHQGMLNHNRDALGYLLRGFFEYYAHMGGMSTGNRRGFDWGREVLSLRTPGGILSKQEKGWTGAKTVVETSTIAAPGTPKKSNGDTAPKTMEETKEIRYRYLFAIEDPFELDHNVARTVTHNGIVNIRDEFRRAWRIIQNVGRNGKEGLLDAVADGERKNGLKEMLRVIHGDVIDEVGKSA